MRSIGVCLGLGLGGFCFGGGLGFCFGLLIPQCHDSKRDDGVNGTGEIAHQALGNLELLRAGILGHGRNINAGVAGVADEAVRTRRVGDDQFHEYLAR